MKTIKKVTVWNQSFFINPNDKTMFFQTETGSFVIGVETLKAAAKRYKGANVIHKPFYLLVAQQFLLKSSTHGLKVEKEISFVSFSESISTVNYTVHP